MHTLDAVDAAILLARDAAPEASHVEVASQLGVSRNTVHARLRRLRESGALLPVSSALRPASLGRPLLAFVRLSVAQQEIATVYRVLHDIPEVVEAHTTTGDADLILKVVAQDPADLHRITQRIQLAPGVHRSSTSIATTEVIAPRVTGLLTQLGDRPRPAGRRSPRPAAAPR